MSLCRGSQNRKKVINLMEISDRLREENASQVKQIWEVIKKFIFESPEFEHSKDNNELIDFSDIFT